MYEGHRNSMRRWGVAAILIALLLASTSLAAGEKKKKAAPVSPAPAKLDVSKFVWPSPPAVARIKFVDFFSAEKVDTATQKKKSGWMDRLAGVAPDGDKAVAKVHFELWSPYGLAIDSKGKLYVADSKVGAIFIFNTETRDVEMIKHGKDAEFGWIVGLAMDDGDRLFVSDSKLHRVLVFDPTHKVEAMITAGMDAPAGLALDKENRFLYVVDTGLDQVLVYDADSFQLLRKIGTTGKQHTSAVPGEFSKPTNAAVDEDGNLYVTDTLNDRVQVFDADGAFISAFGSNGDGPGAFSRPKGIAIDSDGHVWVADGMLNRVQIFTREGKPLFILGGFGLRPGQFQALSGLAIDSQNRVFTTEQLPGRVQMYRYVPDTEARAETERLRAMKVNVDDKNPTGTQPPPAATTPAPKPATPATPQTRGTPGEAQGSAAH